MSSYRHRVFASAGGMRVKFMGKTGSRRSASLVAWPGFRSIIFSTCKFPYKAESHNNIILLSPRVDSQKPYCKNVGTFWKC